MRGIWLYDSSLCDLVDWSFHYSSLVTIPFYVAILGFELTVHALFGRQEELRRTIPMFWVHIVFLSSVYSLLWWRRRPPPEAWLLVAGPAEGVIGTLVCPHLQALLAWWHLIFTLHQADAMVHLARNALWVCLHGQEIMFLSRLN